MDVMAFRGVWRVPGIAPARLAIMLAKAGEPVTHDTILLRIPAIDRTGNDDRSDGVVKVWVAHLRRAMGKEAILNIHSVGYMMPREWREKVLAVLTAGIKGEQQQ